MRRSSDRPSRLLVAQPSPSSGSPLDRVPLAVGLLRPHGQVCSTLLVKLTLAISPDGSRSREVGPGSAAASSAALGPAAPGPGAPLGLSAVVAPEQEPVSLPRPKNQPGAAETELERPLDFVPHRLSPDIVVVGSAYADPPAQYVRCRVAAGGAVRSFVAVAGGPSHRIPLTQAYLRADDGVSPAAAVGPQRGAGAAIAGAAGVPVAAGIPAGAILELTGLSRRAPRVEIALPGLAPRARLMPDGDGLEEEIALVCDTLCIDTDREVIVTWWRGQFADWLVRDGLFHHAVVSLEEDSAPRSLESVAGSLLRGVVGYAVEPEDLLPGAGAAEVAAAQHAEELAMLRYAALESAPEPTMPLERLAAIGAALAEERETRAATFARFDVTEDQLTVEERAWQEKMAHQAMAGDPTVAAEYGERFTEAQDALATPDEEAISLEDYVATRARVEWSGDPPAVLRERAWTLAVWMRLDRRWTRRAGADAAVEAEIESRLEEELTRLGPAPEPDVEALLASATASVKG